MKGDHIFIIILTLAVLSAMLAAFLANQPPHPSPKSYQLDIQDEWTVVMYDEERIVHVFKRDSTSEVFKVIDRDNE